MSDTILPYRTLAVTEDALTAACRAHYAAKHPDSPSSWDKEAAADPAWAAERADWMRDSIDAALDVIEKKRALQSEDAPSCTNPLCKCSDAVTHRGNLVCAKCNDFHDEDSVCGVCHETALQIQREQIQQAKGPEVTDELIDAVHSAYNDAAEEDDFFVESAGIDDLSRKWIGAALRKVLNAK